MNASSLLVLAFAVFGASAAPCMNTVSVLNNGCGGLNTLGLGNVNAVNTVNTVGNFGGLSALNALNAVNTVNCGSAVALQAPNTYVQTGVVENPTTFVPSVVPSVSVSKSCHCVKTVQRPQVRNEYYTVPSVDRLTRYVTTPVVDVATSGGNLVGTNKQFETVLPSSMSGNVLVSNGLVSNGLVSNGLVSNGLVSNGLVSNGLVSNGLVSNGLVSGNVLVQDNNCGCSF